MGEKCVKQPPVCNANGEMRETKGRESAVHHTENFYICVCRIDTDYVEIALVELSEPTSLRILSSPDLSYMESFEEEGQLMHVPRHEPRERDGEVESECDISSPVVSEMENLFIGLTTTFSKKHLCILEYRCIDGNETMQRKVMFEGRDHLFSRDFQIGRGSCRERVG